jgi:integrase
VTKLTAKYVEHVRPKAARQEIPDEGCAGLYLVVQPSGRQSWAVRYRFGGRTRKLTLEGVNSLASARRAATAALEEKAEGRDPAKAHQEAKHKAVLANADTVEAICTEYLRREGSKLRTAEARRRTMERHIFPEIGALPIGTLKRKEVIRLLDKVEDRSGPRMADIVLAILSKVCNWHAVRDEEFRSPLVRGMSRSKPASERARSRTLDDNELRSVWRAANEAGVFGALVKFLLLSAARRDEATRMTRDELAADGTWELPASRNKVKLPLQRPLSQAALDVLPAPVEGCPYFFTADGMKPFANFSRSKAAFDKLCGVSNWRLHDARRTARSLMSRAGVSPDHAEHVLGHVILGQRRTYDRHQFFYEKKAALAALAAQIDRIINPVPNVVALRG